MTSERSGAVYDDPTRSIDDRVSDLLDRMTIDEKLAQLGSTWVFRLADGPDLIEERAAGELRHGIGQVTRISGASFLGAEAAAGLANRIQRHLIEETRLGIPAIIHEEICSGLMARQATIYPQAIGVASTWAPELNQRLASTIREQMRAMGASQGLSPVLDVTRDPRWGRTEETYGEDPYLVARMGTAFVTGLQGDDLGTGVAATAKHFAGYGASEGGLNWAPPHLGERELRDTHLRPFEAAVRQAGLRSVMNAYNELDGVPCAANRALLTEILRHEWGFEGIVVSDYFSIRHLETVHRVAASSSAAGVRALSSGIDSELPETDCYGTPLADAVTAGSLDVAAIDTTVARVLRLKFQLGLFERPYADVGAVTAVTRTADQRALAREIASKSLVLLRNDGVLPLGADTGSIAVIGPNADTARNMLGDYAYPAHAESLAQLMESMQVGVSGEGAVDGGPPDHPGQRGLEQVESEVLAEVGTVLAELRTRLGDTAEIHYAPGCDIASDDRRGFDAATATAAAADVAILVMGDRSGLTTESTSGESRDASSLDLPGVQEDLITAVASTGTPIVLVLVSGRPNGSAGTHERCAAVLMAWLPGEAGAAAIVDALTGATNPGGKLPISYPRSSGQIPVHYGHKPSGGRSNWKGDYVDLPVGPLHPFGFGLSYTTFTLTVDRPASGAYRVGQAVELEVEVTNTGPVAGEEVVQVYARDVEASITRPVLELVGFVRLRVEPGESRRARFEIPVAQLGFHDLSGRYVVEGGEVELLVGSNSRDLAAAGAVTLEDRRSVERAFDGTVTVL
jgi:beta-glucosidase